MLKTVTLEGEELKVDELGGKNTVITNMSSSTLYVSAFPDVEPNNDNVATILAGNAMNLHDTNGTVYLLGTGKVQLMGANFDELPMSALIAAGGGGGSTGDGVSQEYVDNADALTLRSAKKYTDDEIATIEGEIDDTAVATVASANEYTDGEIVKANAANAAAAEKALTDANAYTDEEVTAVRNEIPTIPESLPADGGNAETADKLAPNYIHGNVGWMDFIHISVPNGDYTASFKIDDYNGGDTTNIYGILTVKCFNAFNKLIWEYGSADINPNDFILGYTNNAETGNVEITVFIRLSNSTFRGIYVSQISGGGQSIAQGTTVEIYTGSTFETLPEGYTYVTSTVMPLLNTKELRTELADLKGYIGYTDSDIYGLEADFENNKFTRLAGAVGKTAGADFDSINAFGGRRRCTVLNDGTVDSYYTNNVYFDEDGYTAALSNQHQVMVEQPRFYYKVVPLKVEKIDGADGYHLRKARYYISDTPKPGFKVHPAFIQNGVEIDKIYLSAYEGCIALNNFGLEYLLEDEQTANFDTSVLSSISNAKPASGTTQALTRANARKLAQNRGAGWGITTIQTLSCTQLLFAIEYATFNSQAAIGNGIIAGNDSADVQKTGSTSSLGNASGAVTLGGVSYRGEENLWGNMYKWIDGIAVDNSTETNYGIGYINNTSDIPIAKSSGYISAFSYDVNKCWIFMPSEYAGNTALPVGDINRNAASGTRIFMHGGAVGANQESGIFCGSFSHVESMHLWYVGARLIYIPQPEEVTAND